MSTTQVLKAAACIWWQQCPGLTLPGRSTAMDTMLVRKQHTSAQAQPRLVDSDCQSSAVLLHIGMWNEQGKTGLMLSPREQCGTDPTFVEMDG